MGTETIKEIPALTARARAALNPDGIPAELKALPQWVCWKYTARFHAVTKPPISPRTGQFAASDNPATWATFDQALARFNADKRGVAGIGLMLAEGDDLVFVDLDDRGEIQDELAAKALGWFTGTYAETSPSGGFGAHVICRGQLPGKKGTKQGIFEAYTHPSSRYLTFTGQRLEGHSEAVTVQQEALGHLHKYCLMKQPEPPDHDELLDADCLTTTCPACGATAEYPDCEACGYDFTQAAATGQQPDPISTNTGERPPSSVPVGFDPEARLQLALLNAETRLLYSGDTGKYGDRSRAELALCQRLMTFADGDTGVVGDWLNASGCGKWLERNRDTDAYRASTLAAAAAKWDRKPFEDKRQADIDHGRLLAEALLRNRKGQTGQAGHSQPDTGQPGVSRSGREPGEDDEPVDQDGSDNTPEDRKNAENPLFVPVSSLIACPVAPGWTIRKWLPAASLVVLFGEPSAGKSFLGIDLACHVATGMPWNDCRVKQGAVLYISGEGIAGLRRRFAVWQQQNCVIPDTLYVNERAVTLDAAGAKAVFDAVGSVPDVPTLIVVDTLSSLMDGDENSGQDMVRFLNFLKLLLDGTGATVLIIHHVGHGDKSRERGHSSLRGNIDASFRVEKTDEVGTLTCVKPPKDGAKPQPLSFQLEVVTLPDTWNDPEEPEEQVTSCIFRVTGLAGGGGKEKAARLTDNQKLALRALETAMRNSGTMAEVPGLLTVPFEVWRQAAYAESIGDTPENSRKNFGNAYKRLLVDGHVLQQNGNFYLAAVKQNAVTLLWNLARKNAED